MPNRSINVYATLQVPVQITCVHALYSLCECTSGVVFQQAMIVSVWLFGVYMFMCVK